jgi:hypothetical protein
MALVEKLNAGLPLAISSVSLELSFENNTCKNGNNKAIEKTENRTDSTLKTIFQMAYFQYPFTYGKIPNIFFMGQIYCL